MNDDEILGLQRALRQRLFEGPHAVRWRPGRELVAQLLLYLDDPAACWRLTTQWLREALDADRVDGGFGGFATAQGHHDYVVMAETQRDEGLLPSVLGHVFDARDAGLAAVWATTTLLPIESVQQTADMSPALRSTLRALGTSAKLAMPVHDGPLQVGIICADWRQESPRWSTSLCLEVAHLTRDALGPVMAASLRLARLASRDNADADATSAIEWAALTPAERRLAALVAQGISYKEAARTLDRSLSTVDHQLRSIRHKLGATSTARLVRLLNEPGAQR